MLRVALSATTEQTAMIQCLTAVFPQPHTCVQTTRPPWTCVRLSAFEIMLFITANVTDSPQVSRRNPRTCPRTTVDGLDAHATGGSRVKKGGRYEAVHSASRRVHVLDCRHRVRARIRRWARRWRTWVRWSRGRGACFRRPCLERSWLRRSCWRTRVERVNGFVGRSSRRRDEYGGRLRPHADSG